MTKPPCENYGDVTLNGDINILDSQLVMQHINDPVAYPLTAEQTKRADVDGDGVVTAADQQLIMDYVFGAITTFPICSMLGDFVVSEFTTSPRECYSPGDIHIHIVWENVGTGASILVPGFTVNGVVYQYDSVTLDAGAACIIDTAINAIAAGDYEICPSPPY